MAGWYFSVNGRAEGPVSEDVLRDGLKSGRFTLVDLVFREGSAGWTTLGEIPEFRDAFEALPLPKTDATDPQFPDDDTDEITNTDLRTRVQTRVTSFKEPEVRTTPPATEKFDTPAKPTALGKMPPAPAWIVLKKKATGFEQAGPYTEEQILDLIGRGDVEYSMYAWKPGYKRWVRIGNLPEFDRRRRDRENDPVNQVVPLPKVENFENWPKAEDLAKSIEVLKRPDPRAEAPKAESPPPETNGIDLTHVQPRHATANQVPPPQAAPAPTQAAPQPMSFKIDQAHQDDAVRVVPGHAPEATTSATPDSSSLDVDVEETSNVTESKRRKKRSGGLPFWQRAAVALVAAGFVVVGVLAAAHWWNLQKTKEQSARNDEIVNETAQTAPQRAARSAAPPAPPPPSEADEAEEADESARTDSPSTAQAPQPEAPKKQTAVQAKAAALGELGLRPLPPSPNGATVLEIVPMKLTTPSPMLVFQTDAAVGETIDVKIHAKPGDILKWVSYSNNYLVRRGNGEIASLDLTKFSLPKGSYRIEASVGKIKKTATIFVGVRDADFEADRRDHLKNISQVQQAEKKALFYSAQRLEKLTNELGDQSKKLKSQPAKWKKYYADWKRKVKEGARPAMNVARTDRPEMSAYPELFNDFAEAMEELNQQAKQVDQSVVQKRNVATVPLPVARSFKKLRVDASKLTSGAQ